MMDWYPFYQGFDFKLLTDAEAAFRSGGYRHIVEAPSLAFAKERASTLGVPGTTRIARGLMSVASMLGNPFRYPDPHMITRFEGVAPCDIFNNLISWHFDDGRVEYSDRGFTIE